MVDFLKKLIGVAAFLFAIIGLVLVVQKVTGGEHVVLDHAPDQTNDLAALQRGSKTFVNYCLNCHAASSMRYNRLRDIGIDEDTIKANLLFTSDKVGDLMTISMQPKDAKAWFGVIPPDLSVIARAKNSEDGSGVDYLYTYLRGFYKDDTRPTGWNNIVFHNVGMPHVLWELQGIQKPVYVDEKDEEGKVERKLDHLEIATPGKMSKQDYDNTVADLVSYLDWMSEPTAHLRHQLGVWVLLFLGVLATLCWRLNASYWKEVK
jgi:ubiquinol-cytochrome c reductase cytochrome c1 subunit